MNMSGGGRPPKAHRVKLWLGLKVTGVQGDGEHVTGVGDGDVFIPSGLEIPGVFKVFSSSNSTRLDVGNVSSSRRLDGLVSCLELIFLIIIAYSRFRNLSSS